MTLKVAMHCKHHAKNSVEHTTTFELLKIYHNDGLVQERSISIDNALETLQSCTKPSI